MQNEPLVSIIINCYNGEKYLQQTLKSIVNQKFSNWELIFWDNQSTDGSKKIFYSFKDPRFKYFYANDHTTLYKARNLACEQTKGSYIAFVDCDDWWDEEYLESRKEFFLDGKFDFSYSNCMHYFEDTQRYELFTRKKLESGKIFNFLSKNYLVKISCFIIKSSIFFKEIKFNNNYNIIGDYEYVMRISSQYTAFAVQKPLANIRFHNKNYLDQNRKMFYYEYLNWYKNLDFENTNYSSNRFLFVKQIVRLKIISLLPKFLINKFKKK